MLISFVAGILFLLIITLQSGLVCRDREVHTMPADRIPAEVMLAICGMALKMCIRDRYEDDDFRVILDLGPATKGHALILPKHHYANLYEIPEEMAAKAMVLAKRMAAAMTEALGCDGFNIVQNNGEVAGQTVFHFHMHLIPRYNGDQAGITWKPGELKDEVRDEIVAKVTAALM